MTTATHKDLRELLVKMPGGKMPSLAVFKKTAMGRCFLTYGLIVAWAVCFNDIQTKPDRTELSKQTAAGTNFVANDYDATPKRRTPW